MGYTLGGTPDLERYTRVERRRDNDEEIHAGSDDDGASTLVTATASTTVDAESQTCSDFMNECKKTKDELQTNQDFGSEVADLRKTVDSLSLAANLKSNSEKLKFYTVEYECRNVYV